VSYRANKGECDPGVKRSQVEAVLDTEAVEVFCDDPDALIARALEAGAKGSLEHLENHQRPWGTHRQGGFTDPFGHIWLVGDKSPLSSFP
jgi:uncharacterized glyoxalase superfamily protein PhnB